MKLFFVYTCDEIIGEVQAVFDESDKMLGCWSNDDANWRNEYFDPFMRELGFTCVCRAPTKKELQLMRESFGYQNGKWK